jgi:hypothetical protein
MPNQKVRAVFAPLFGQDRILEMRIIYSVTVTVSRQMQAENTGGARRK